MKPTVAQIRAVANPILSNMLISYMNNSSDFVATAAAPTVSVNEESGTYFILDATYFFATQLERRAYGDTFAQGGYALTTDTYKTLQWGLEHPIPVEHEATSQVPMSLQSLATEWLATQSLIRKETSFAADFMIGSAWSTENSSATDWDSTGTPVADIALARRTVRQAVGVGANAAVMGEIVWDALQTNAQITGLVAYTNSLTQTTRDSLIASTLGLDYLFVSRAVRNTANLNAADSISPIIDDDCLVCIVKPGADMMTISSLKTFVWNPGGGQGSVKSYFSNERNSTILQHQEQWDQKLIGAGTGYIFTDIV